MNVHRCNYLCTMLQSHGIASHFVFLYFLSASFGFAYPNRCEYAIFCLCYLSHLQGFSMISYILYFTILSFFSSCIPVKLSLLECQQLNKLVRRILWAWDLFQTFLYPFAVLYLNDSHILNFNFSLSCTTFLGLPLHWLSWTKTCCYFLFEQSSRSLISSGIILLCFGMPPLALFFRAFILYPFPSIRDTLCAILSSFPIFWHLMYYFPFHHDFWCAASVSSSECSPIWSLYLPLILYSLHHDSNSSAGRLSISLLSQTV